MVKRRKRLDIPREWTFRSRDVARRFDSHVREQLPWYELATGIVAHIARCYVPDRGRVIDVGCSTGNIARALAPTLKARGASIVGIDSAPDMSSYYQAVGSFHLADARSFDFDRERPDLVVCFLILQFVPIVDRPALVERMRRSLRPGGALIIFDKMVPRPGYVGTVAYRLTLAAKLDAGASPAEVVAKELSVSGVQRPLRDDELDGFVEVFRFGDFAGFVYERAAA